MRVAPAPVSQQAAWGVLGPERLAGLGGLLFVALFMAVGWRASVGPIQYSGGCLLRHGEALGQAVALLQGSALAFLLFLGGLWAALRRAEPGQPRLRGGVRRGNHL